MLSSRVRAIAPFALLFACSSDPAPAPTPDATVTDVASVDVTAPDASTPEAATLDAACGADAIARALTWADAPAFPLRVDHHGTFVRTTRSGSTFLYVAGGIRQGAGERMEAVYDQVHRARIGTDGALGMWEPIARLPVAVGYHGTAQSASRVYLVAGITVDTTSGAAAGSRALLIGDFDDDGGITWRRGTGVSAIYVHPSLSILNDKLVLIGGTDGRAARNRTLVSAILPDGSNGPWEDGPSLPTPRSHHTTVVFHDRLYIAGGFSGMPVGNMTEPQPDILRSVHGDAGSITGWEAVGTLPDPPATHSAVVHDDQMYILGGVVGSSFVATVRRAPFNCDGTVGDFEELDDLPVARSHTHQTPDFAGHVYSVGGRVLPAATSFDRVFVGAWR